MLLIAQSLVVALAVELPYIRVEPGSATDVLDLVTVVDAEQFPAGGDLLFLTVSLSQRLTPVEAIAAELDPDVELRREEVYTGGRPREEVTRVNLAAMEQSKNEAVKVALEYLGYDVGVTGEGAMVVGVASDRPAAELLVPGDVVTAIEGRRVTGRDDVLEALGAVEPGDEVALTVRRGEEVDTIEVPTVDSGDGTAQMGVLIEDDLSFDFPLDVEINTGRVGGPSAGLAFALALLDELTEGELTGGRPVAVTGEIDIEGNVTRVGGVRQKAVAARRAGAVMMLVPRGEAELARPRAGSMEVVGVANIEEALAALGDLGGNALALPRDLGARETASSAR